MPSCSSIFDPAIAGAKYFRVAVVVLHERHRLFHPSPGTKTMPNPVMNQAIGRLNLLGAVTCLEPLDDDPALVQPLLELRDAGRGSVSIQRKA